MEINSCSSVYIFVRTNNLLLVVTLSKRCDAEVYDQHQEKNTICKIFLLEHCFDDYYVRFVRVFFFFFFVHMSIASSWSVQILRCTF